MTQESNLENVTLQSLNQRITDKYIPAYAVHGKVVDRISTNGGEYAFVVFTDGTFTEMQGVYSYEDAEVTIYPNITAGIPHCIGGIRELRALERVGLVSKEEVDLAEANKKIEDDAFRERCNYMEYLELAKKYEPLPQDAHK